MRVSTGCPWLVACCLQSRVGVGNLASFVRIPPHNADRGTRLIHRKDFDSSASLVRDIGRGQGHATDRIP